LLFAVPRDERLNHRPAIGLVKLDVVLSSPAEAQRKEPSLDAVVRSSPVTEAVRPRQLTDLAQAERFQLLIDAVKDYAIFLLDADGNVATWNTGAQIFKGYTAQEIIGKHFSVFYTE
jgi:PAS domain-containing protein